MEEAITSESQEIKIFGKKFKKEVKDFFNEDYVILLKEIKDDTKKWNKRD